MLFANFTDGIMLHCLTGKINRHDSLCPGSNQLLYRFRVNIVGIRPDIGKHRFCTTIQYTIGGCRKGNGADNDLISRPKACCQSSYMQGCRTVAHCHCILGTSYPGKLFFQSIHSLIVISKLLI